MSGFILGGSGEGERPETLLERMRCDLEMTSQHVEIDVWEARIYFISGNRICEVRVAVG